MEAPFMDADKPMIRINPAQEEFDRTQAAYASKRARKIAENDALNRIQLGDKLDDFPARS
jgi:hypothetical protein